MWRNTFALFVVTFICMTVLLIPVAAVLYAALGGLVGGIVVIGVLMLLQWPFMKLIGRLVTRQEHPEETRHVKH